ncbi:restriction endonuclease [Acidiluteibacter ferrifornacis]|uniref:ATPase n=1 Tax=Acidiluteibacter ferrifornacis TaxID=2692424 RepID=A0A6N9NKC1_9FLAO|nr:restriction endonuclease [Acidiluteibacter ferrifornacis]NBG66314.1 ATPase [Acidiluteibacter ferrifornacis]
MESILIKKKSGEKEAFSFSKLRASLERSGANDSDVAYILERLKPQLYDGITTQEIYRKAFALLKKENRVYASKYSLKKALFDLGPTGYPFESMIAALLRKRGYHAEVSVTLQGECVTHEIDVLAEKDGATYAIECKYHAKSHFVNNVKVPLYINSRFLDIQKKWNNDSHKNTQLKQGWLVSNTKFTLDAIQYANCVGLELLSWNYPANNGINKLIDSYGLYPVTTLTTLTKREKELIMENDVILVKELVDSPAILDKLAFSAVRKNRILSEAHSLIEFDNGR